MEYFVREYPDCLRQVFTKIDAKAVSKEFDSVLNNLQKNFNFAGYRKGKVPVEIIEKQNPPELEQRVVTNLVNQVLDQILKDGIRLFSKPKFNPFSNLVRGQEFSFYLVFEVSPQVHSEIDFKKLSVSYEDFSVDDKMVTYSMTKRLAGLEKVTTKIVEDDTVTLSITNSDYKSEDKEMTFNASKVAALIGKKAGDSVTLEFSDLGDNVMQVLGKLKAPLSAEIKLVERANPKSISDESVQQMSPYKTVAEYKESIKKELVQLAEHYSGYNKRQALEAAVGEKAEIEFPKSIFVDAMSQNVSHFVSDQYQANELKLTELLADKTIRDRYTELLDVSYEKIAFLIMLDYIADINNIKATEEQVNYIAAAVAREQRMTLEDYKKSCSRDEWSKIEKDAIREAAEKWVFDQVKFTVKGSKPLIEVK